MCPGARTWCCGATSTFASMWCWSRATDSISSDVTRRSFRVYFDSKLVGFVPPTQHFNLGIFVESWGVTSIFASMWCWSRATDSISSDVTRRSLSVYQFGTFLLQSWQIFTAYPECQHTNSRQTLGSHVHFRANVVLVTGDRFHLVGRDEKVSPCLSAITKVDRFVPHTQHVNLGMFVEAGRGRARESRSPPRQ